ncbi:UDP-N-acetylglucosamine 1-carboxyvinyltransferase [Parvularcula bermudensis HTCC2503]|uniref:UDP-N-acetylglucosamine 1-carboxyvinyltransferase n=1 Tax=Parvularcula bermudensis (strain ATCC BAA-594 / HTCC2503 / KCTC 12087) TaxID=314260 RepID=E0TBY8_PARBH|nr:UDP-N-acetylglucosamine 1-carboxyvinyltransferase [Parvularcula bermudensis]ADM08481.1 UDP-N-acetylglucosamine 1-carboxyvinyltransferase [Parvularcula bermudensis HTCC2503]
MDKLAIIGGRELYGVLPVSGAKNSALKVMVASLLTEECLTLENVPSLADVRQLMVLLDHLGVAISGGGTTLHLTAETLRSTLAPYDIVRKMRASFNVLGPLLAREGKAKVSLPGGCAIGARPVDQHLKALEALGAEIDLDEGYVLASAERGLRGASITFPFVSVGATEHTMMTATLAKGETILENAAREPEIVDIAECLRMMGAKIEGDGTSTIKITGVDRLSGGTHRVVPDRVEMGSYAMAVGAVGGELLLEGGRLDLLGAAKGVLLDAGLSLSEEEGGVRVKKWGRPTVGTDIRTEPFPGFPTDLQAQYMALMALADGTSVIRETVFENRFMHVPELMRLGADIRVDGQQATVRGKPVLKGAPVMATDLRASMSLIVAGLAAEGQTLLSRLYHLDRGFERLDEKLRAVGALVERVAVPD